MKSKRVCVIGAGASGLVTIKELLQEGHLPECYEANSSFGGVFFYQKNKGGVYDNTYLTISNYRMAFSDFPPHENKRHYWHFSEYYNYLMEYIKAFDLSPHIHFSTEVQDVTKKGELWHVKIKNLLTNDVKILQFDCVAVCSGTFQIPKMVDIEGLHTFPGKIYHSNDYKNNNLFKDEKVLCIGIGESSADITKEISDVTKKCCLSIKSYPYIIPRNFNMHGTSITSDVMDTRLIYREDSILESQKLSVKSICLYSYMLLWSLVYTILVYPFIKLSTLSTRKKTDVFGQSRKENFMDLSTKNTSEARKLIFAWKTMGDCDGSNKFATKNATFITNILNNKLDVNASGIKRIAGNDIYFNDDQIFTADKIVLCTGYKDEFPFLSGEVNFPNNDVRNLYQNAFNHKVGASLIFIGWVRPSTGGVPVASEMLARYFALICSGKRKLPNDLENLIKKRKRDLEKRFEKSVNVKSLVEYPVFMDTMAELIGCKPKWYKYIFFPFFLLRLLTGTADAYQYRLEGEHSNKKLATKLINRSNLLPILSIALIYRILYLFRLNDGYLGNLRFLGIKLSKQDIKRFKFKQESGKM